jgi:hypothetical protein
VPIHNHKDYRVNQVADLIEYIKDYKYHTRSIEIAEEVVKLLDNIQGIEYARKIKNYLENERAFRGNGTT